MSRNKIKFRQQGRNGASLDPTSFCITWSYSASLDEVYEKIEDAWSKQQVRREDRKTFYSSRRTGHTQLRGRATKCRNKGVSLKSLRGEQHPAPTGRVDYGYLASLVEQINEETQSANQAAGDLKDSYTRYRSRD